MVVCFVDICGIVDHHCLNFLIIIWYLQLGGTIGDIEGMPFIEAFRQFFHFRVKREDYCLVHVSLVPQVSDMSNT